MMKKAPLANVEIASNRTPRRINRNLLFNMIRTKSISRADLVRLSGLQFSTVSAIVEELIADGWIVEGSSGRLPRGRRPTLLQVNDQLAVIALDVHPTEISIGISDLSGALIAQKLVALENNGKTPLAALIAAIRDCIQAHADKSFLGVGICLPGRTDLALQELTFAPNLDWTHIRLKLRIERSLGMRVAMDNVANACALAEVWFGGSDRSRDIVVVNVSEGIGTGIFANGSLLRGSSGMAGEFGHVVLDSTGVACSCGLRGCWETLASNRAALRYYHEFSGGRRIRTFGRLLELAEKKDEAAVAALSRMSVELGRGMRMIAAAIDPREIIVVGSITRLWSSFGPLVEAEMRRNSGVKTPCIHPSSSGADARLYGAVALVLNEGSV